jgi:hypothetical protein
MCDVLLPPGVNPTAVKYIYHIIIFPWGKGGRCVGLTTLPPLCADCLKIWERQPPETLRAYQGL